MYLTTFPLRRVLLALLLGVVLWPSAQAQAAVSNWQKGITMTPRWNTDYGSDSFKQSVDNAARVGVNYVTLVIPYYQSNIYSTDVAPGWNTPTDESLVSGIRYVQSKDMRVNLKPHLDPYDGNWRARIDPGDRNGWFWNYGNMLKKYARIAADNGVAEITIGSELIGMSANDKNDNTTRWKTLIAEVRTIYHGLLTYSANWGSGEFDEKDRITFWSDLDSIGISAYYPLNTNDTSVEGFKREWQRIHNEDIRWLADQYGKPILFTEVGYRSIDWAHWAPFEYGGGGNPDQGEQARLYEALFSYWNDVGNMQGVQLWDWSTDPNAGGEGNQHYTPQHKQAEQVMARWFGSPPTPNPNPNPQPQPSPDTATFDLTATADPNPVTQGSTVRVNATVRNTGSTANNVIVDVEIHNNSGKVFQKFYEGQSFNAGESKSFGNDWTVTGTGTYTVKMGMFNSTWSKNYIWNDAATIFGTSDSSGGNGGNPPGPVNGSYTVNLWWPTNGAALSGNQPFKAMVEGLDISQYSLWWRVDGGTWTELYNSNEDYPHKEVWVDVSNWNWKQNGPYTIDFEARNQSGVVIGTAKADITIAR